MNSPLTPVKFLATSRGWRLFLFLVALAATMLLSAPVLAQKEEVKGLNLSLRGSGGRDFYNQEARADQDNKFSLEVRNTGTIPLTNIRLSVEEPEGWLIEINPAVINSLSAGSLETVDVNIRPVGKAIKDQYQINFTAEANEIKQAQPFWVTVKPAQSWLWVWIAAGVVVVAGFVLIYLRFGRE